MNNRQRTVGWIAWRVLIITVVLFPTAGAAENSPSDGTLVSDRAYEIPAWSFERGNARVFTSSWADAEPMIAFGGEDPWTVEYDIDLPIESTFTFSVKYAAQDRRPLALAVDEERFGDVCGDTTGSWNTSGAQWKPVLQHWLAPGKHTLRLTSAAGGPPPHLVALRIEAERPFPADWMPCRPKARKIDASFTSMHRPATVPSCDSVRRLLDDYAATFGAEQFPDMAAWRADLDEISYMEELAAPMSGESAKEPTGDSTTWSENSESVRRLSALARTVALANPLLDFDTILFVERKSNSPSLGLPTNWQSNSSLSRGGFDDRIARLNLRTGDVETVFRPGEKFVGDVDLDFDAGRVLFSMIDPRGIWQIWEMGLDTAGNARGEPVMLSGQEPDVESYDACYLPDGDVMYTNTGAFVGVPCVNGDSHVSMIYRMSRDADGAVKSIRQLCFEQEHDWCPVVLNSGRVMYTRWEYTDTPHSNTRLLFSMNPDGTGQMEYVGSNSYWPNSFFYARPIPGHPTKVVSVVGGHHDNPRMGELVIFDPVRGRQENQSAVQQIPGCGKPVPMIIRDGLTLSSWPKFLHPFPLNEHYFIVACRPSASMEWGIYLVDTFDNFTLLHEAPDMACLEPVPLKEQLRPPVIPEKVDLTKQTATVYIDDIYAGSGLQGVPRGAVKQLRIGTYNFSFQEMGGLYGVVGADGPWDVRRTVGTVPVNPDGSAKFTVPANVPLMFQPLDENGAALQLMRSWSTAMPGETVQCTGCHEKQNTTAPLGRSTLALDAPPAQIIPWRGPIRGFSFAREVQPVLDHYCVACHNGTNTELPDFRGDVKLTDWSSVMPGNGGYVGMTGRFTVGYWNIARYVRRPGIESDYHMLEPMEFHVGTTDLFRRLGISTATLAADEGNASRARRGHYGVRLDPESIDRLTVWIDFNSPFHGTWSGREDAAPGVDVSMWDTDHQATRRRELARKYANLDDDPEAIIRGDTPLAGVPEFIPDPRLVEYARMWKPAGTPPTPTSDSAKETYVDNPVTPATGKTVLLSHRTMVVGDDAVIEMVYVPRSSREGVGGLWVATQEMTNAVYNCFDPHHDSRIEDKPGYQFGIHGMPANLPEQPVVRVSSDEAERFCAWLSEQTDGELQFRLPTVSEWEYAAMAGAEPVPGGRGWQTPFWFGAAGGDFSTYENLADASLTRYVTDPYTVDTPLPNPPKYDDWIPKDARYDDGSVIAVAPRQYLPNPWGLYDVHGNVQEWTATPSVSAGGEPDGRRIVCGGSWRDRPSEATIQVRRAYQSYQRVFNVGFRVVAEPATK